MSFLLCLQRKFIARNVHKIPVSYVGMTVGNVLLETSFQSLSQGWVVTPDGHMSYDTAYTDAN